MTAGYPANPFGISVKPGNAWKLCSDCYGAFPDTAEFNPAGFSEGVVHVRRGGSWNSCDQTTTRTGQDSPGHRGSGIGFRVADDIE